MIKKSLAIRCNKCYNIINGTGKCYCGALALIKQQGCYYIYTDDEDYSFVSVYTDEKGRKVKVLDADIIKKTSVVVPLDKEIVDNFKVVNVKRKDIK